MDNAHGLLMLDMSLSWLVTQTRIAGPQAAVEATLKAKTLRHSQCKQRALNRSIQAFHRRDAPELADCPGMILQYPSIFHMILLEIS